MDAETRKQVERATYDRKLGRERPAYASFWNRGLYDAMMSAELEPELERLAGEHLAGRRVLVLGAGADEIRLVQRFTDRIWALNISERAVAELSREFPSVRAFVADAEQLDAIGERFDVVYCKSILHHLHPLDRVLASIARRLAPGGVLFVAMEPGLYNPFAALGRRFTPSQSHTPGERALVFSDFSRLARR
jgi:SAM-dependent methyltransferase